MWNKRNRVGSQLHKTIQHPHTFVIVWLQAQKGSGRAERRREAGEQSAEGSSVALSLQRLPRTDKTTQVGWQMFTIDALFVQ